jgi:hypothetical protein
MRPSQTNSGFEVSILERPWIGTTNGKQSPPTTKLQILQYVSHSAHGVLAKGDATWTRSKAGTPSIAYTESEKMLKWASQDAGPSVCSSLTMWKCCAR